MEVNMNLTTEVDTRLDRLFGKGIAGNFVMLALGLLLATLLRLPYYFINFERENDGDWKELPLANMLAEYKDKFTPLITSLLMEVFLILPLTLQLIRSLHNRASLKLRLLHLFAFCIVTSPFVL